MIYELMFERFTDYFVLEENSQKKMNLSHNLQTGADVDISYYSICHLES